MVDSSAVPVRSGKSHAVAEILRHEIASGVLKVGADLPSEVEVAKRFAVSRPSYREALRALQAEGLIAVTRGAHGGARVVAPDIATLERPMSLFIQRMAATLDDLFAALENCEPVIVRELANKKDRRFARDLAKHVARQEFSLNDRTIFNEAEWEFRRIMTQNSSDKIMRTICDLLGYTFYHHIRVLNERRPWTQGDRDPLRKSIATKRRFVTAVSDGQADEAAALWAKYIHAFKTELGGMGVLGVIEVYNREIVPTLE